MKKSKWLDCQGNEFFPKQKGTPSLVKIEHKNTATLDSARSKKKSKVAVLQLGCTTVSSSLYICVCTPQYLVVFSRISGSSRTLHIFSHVLPVIVHKPGKQVSTLKAYAIMRLSSFAYRITTQDWENLSALQNSTFSEHGHVAYQIKADDNCSNIQSHILSL